MKFFVYVLTDVAGKGPQAQALAGFNTSTDAEEYLKSKQMSYGPLPMLIVEGAIVTVSKGLR